MDQPLGRYVGNAAEVIETLQVLEGGGPADLIELTRVLGGEMLRLGGVVASEADGQGRILEVLQNGEALQRLQRCAAMQGAMIDLRDQSEPWRQTACIRIRCTWWRPRLATFRRLMRKRWAGPASRSVQAASAKKTPSIRRRTSTLIAKSASWSKRASPVSLRVFRRLAGRSTGTGPRAALWGLRDFDDPPTEKPLILDVLR